MNWITLVDYNEKPQLVNLDLVTAIMPCETGVRVLFSKGEVPAGVGGIAFKSSFESVYRMLGRRHKVIDRVHPELKTWWQR